MSGAPYAVEDGRLSELAASVYKETGKNGERQKKRRISCGVFERRGGGVRQPAWWWSGGRWGPVREPASPGGGCGLLPITPGSLPPIKQTNIHANKETQNEKKKNN